MTRATGGRMPGPLPVRRAHLRSADGGTSSDRLLVQGQPRARLQRSLEESDFPEVTRPLTACGLEAGSNSPAAKAGEVLGAAPWKRKPLLDTRPAGFTAECPVPGSAHGTHRTLSNSVRGAWVETE